MTKDEKACAEFEIAALRQVRGALDSAAASRLAAHLSGCGDCTRFAEMARAAEALMRRQARSALTEPGRAVLRIRLREGRARILRSALILALIVGFQAWSRGWAGALAIGGLALVIALAGLFSYILPRRRRALASASASEGDLVAGMRADLSRDIQLLRKGRFLRVILGGIGALGLAFSAYHLAQDLWLEPRALVPLRYVPTFTFGALLAFNVWYDEWRRLPRLEREREDLA